MKEKKRMLDKNNMTLKLEKMTKQSIGKNQISSNELSRKRSLQERGITLIALVVTIIILLILAEVTLNMALSQNGLFSKTKEAVEKYKQAQSDEEEMIRQIATQMYSEYVGAEVTGYDLNENNNTAYTTKTEETGYDEDQTINRDTNMTWKIWDFDGNTLRLIGNPTKDKIYLKGAKGYNNGVMTLDKICETLYSNNKQGVTVRNLKRSDIQKVSTYDYTNYKHQKNTWKEDTSSDYANTIQFGESLDVRSENFKYPSLWEENDEYWEYEYDDTNKCTDDGDKECKRWEVTGGKNSGESSVEVPNLKKFKTNYYAHGFSKSEFVDENYFELIFNDGENYFWLGTRYGGFSMSCEMTSFGICYVNPRNGITENLVIGWKLFEGNGGDVRSEYNASLRPVISINMGKRLEFNEVE